MYLMELAGNFIPHLLFGGYRSFGNPPQRFERFAIINLLIGPNNSGKSNVLRFIHEVYPKLASQQSRPTLNLGPLDQHRPGGGSLRYGVRLSLATDSSGVFPEVHNLVVPRLRNPGMRESMPQAMRVLSRKAELDGTGEAVWFEFGHHGPVSDDDWALAFKVLSDQELHHLWGNLTGSSGGSRDGHWIPGVIEKLTPAWRSVSTAMIPAIRSVGGKGTQPDGFGGHGLIEKLARLQNPDVHQQSEKNKFARVNAFLQSVTDNETATLEIPYERDTILVHMNSKTLPLESLGTGIHEVIILAAASTILEGTVVCMEEPEIHLNPILQRKLIRYLASKTTNQYFITTHSAALMDTPEAETYHIQLRDNQSTVTRVTSDKHRSMVCEDLGYHPSDLLQANCLIWVEGPSDRIYLAHWLLKRAPDLVEGIHFSIMFYGGRLASHLSGHDLDGAIEGFISLRRLNRRTVIVIDSDRAAKGKPLNPTKTRLVAEFDEGPGHAWVTDGREIENYLPADQITGALAAVVSTATVASRFRRYDKVLSIKTAGGKLRQAPKVEVAKHIVAKCNFDDSRLDLKERLDKLVRFIRESNPSNEQVTA
jgi:hypothetical protein